MLLQFKVEKDGTFWICNTQTLQWAQVSQERQDDESKVLQHGRLVPQGFGIYRLEGLSGKTEDAGAGLVSIGNYVVAIGQTVKIFIRANVPIKDFTMPVPIRQVLYEILPTDPQQIQNSIQEVANADQSGQEVAPAEEKSAQPGAVEGPEPPAEQSAPETSLQCGNGSMDSLEVSD